jgi:hypothetical protein
MLTYQEVSYQFMLRECSTVSHSQAYLLYDTLKVAMLPIITMLMPCIYGAAVFLISSTYGATGLVPPA